MYLVPTYSIMKQSSCDDAPKTAVYIILTNSIFITVQGQSRILFPNLDPTVKYITQYNTKWNQRRNIKCTALNIRKNSRHKTAAVAAGWGALTMNNRWTDAVKMVRKLSSQYVQVRPCLNTDGLFFFFWSL